MWEVERIFFHCPDILVCVFFLLLFLPCFIFLNIVFFYFTSSRGLIINAMNFRPMNLDSVAAVTHELLLASQRASGQIAPKLQISRAFHQGTSKRLSKGGRDINRHLMFSLCWILLLYFLRFLTIYPCWSFARLIAPDVTTTSFTLSSNKT